MSRLRQRVAERLLQSQQTNAILTTFNEVNMQPVMSGKTRRPSGELAMPLRMICGVSSRAMS